MEWKRSTRIADNNWFEVEVEMETEEECCSDRSSCTTLTQSIYK